MRLNSIQLLEPLLTKKLLLTGENMHPKKTTHEQTISDLKNSAQTVGQLYPALVDKKGNIIDGKHRLKADPKWPTLTIKTIDSEEDRLLATLVANVCRRKVSSVEKTNILENLGRIYLKKGLNHSQLAKRISEKTGMTYRWVMKYLPDYLKMRPGLGGPKKLKYGKIVKDAALIADKYELLKKSQKKVVNIVNYSNTNFATIILDKKFYLKLKEASSALGVNPSVIINNALLQTLQKVEKLANENNPSILMCVSK